MDIVIAAVVLVFSITGGMMVYTDPRALHGLYIVGNLLIIAAVSWSIYRRRWPPFAPVLGWVLVGLGMSMVANLNAIPAGLCRLWLLLIAVSVMTITSYLPHEKTFNGLRLAAVCLLPVWAIFWMLGWFDNKNILAFYPMIFLALSLTTVMVGGYVAFLAVLGCRGAVLGSIVSTSFLIYPYIRRYFKLYVTIGAISFVGLVSLSPGSSAARVIYLGQAAAAFLSSPWFGVGLGELPSLCLLHAHNFLISLAAETGLIGLGFTAIAAWRLYQIRHNFIIERWHVAVLIAVLAHSLVDEPLWWPGPLLTFAIILGSIRRTPCPEKL